MRGSANDDGKLNAIGQLEKRETRNWIRSSVGALPTNEQRREGGPVPKPMKRAAKPAGPS